MFALLSSSLHLLSAAMEASIIEEKNWALPQVELPAFTHHRSIWNVFNDI